MIPVPRIAVCWLAALAVLFGAIAPGLSSGPAGQDAPWKELCVAGLITRAAEPLTQPTRPTDSDPADTLSVCPFCLPAGAHSPPSVRHDPVSADLAHISVAMADLVAAEQPRCRRTGDPRGPPVPRTDSPTTPI